MMEIFPHAKLENGKGTDNIFLAVSFSSFLVAIKYNQEIPSWH